MQSYLDTFKNNQLNTDIMDAKMYNFINAAIAFDRIFQNQSNVMSLLIDTLAERIETSQYDYITQIFQIKYLISINNNELERKLDQVESNTLWAIKLESLINNG